jgi:hypothetical protein
MQLPVTESEEQLQTACFIWHWNNRPAERRRLFHVNQKARNAIEGNRMKAMGVVPGVSDLIYLSPSGPVFIEMKTDTGTQSKEQREFQALVESLGYQYIISRSLAHFQSLFP